MVLKGQNLRLKLGNKFIAGAQSCQIHVAAQLEESSSKDNTGDWQEQEVTGKSWDGQTDALVMVDSDDAGAVTGLDALDLVGTKVLVSYEQCSGAKNREAVSSGEKRYGYAIVNDVTVTAANKSNSTYTVQFQGVGALSKEEPSE